MKIKDDVQVSTDDFWYDLTTGGYLRPEEILEHPSDVKRVEQAIRVLEDFEGSCEDEIPNFVR